MTRARRRTLLACVGLAVLLVVLAVWLVRRYQPPLHEDRLTLEPATFADLPGWGEDTVGAALAAFQRSCQRRPMPPAGAAEELDRFGVTANDWATVCSMAVAVPDDDATVRAFFERWFQPFAAAAGRDREGLFTGYYEPLLRGSLRRSARYRVPLYARPPEVVAVDLGAFRAELRGQRLAGKVVDGALVPLPDRRAIDHGALAGRGLELAWLESPVDAFFLQVQGSGVVRLQEGGEMRVGYAGENGHPYTSIGKELIRRGAFRPEEVSMQAIRRWIAQHPKAGQELLERDASYVFFEPVQGKGPRGAEKVLLTPGRSLAVDRKHWPLGVPLWLDTTAPSPRESEPARPFRRLLIAQDTGGAIRGPVRGDIFWGTGPDAEEIAGRMKHPGRLWVLLPKPLSAPRGPASRRG